MANKKNKLIIVIIVLVVFALLLLYDKNEKECILNQYDSNGKLTSTSEYIIKDGDTILHGKFINYNKNGVKIAEGNFVNGHVKGKWLYYYNNGELESICYRKGSKITEEITEFHPNGKVKRYIMFDPFGLEAFIVRFDEQEIMKSYEGYSIMEIYQYPIANKERFNIKEEQYLKVGDTLKYTYLVANIPNTKRSFAIENVGIDNAKVKRILKNVPPAKIDVKEVLTKKGKNTIRNIVRYEFNDNVTPVFTDTLSFDVEVH
jgi:antitoxin component YwqK of YwqJK toxin-antitoxin module